MSSSPEEYFIRRTGMTGVPLVCRAPNLNSNPIIDTFRLKLRPIHTKYESGKSGTSTRADYHDQGIAFPPDTGKSPNSLDPGFGIVGILTSMLVKA